MIKNPQKMETGAKGEAVNYINDNLFYFFFHCRNRTVRNFHVWKHFANYFQLNLVKTVDIPPTKNYVLAFFPHGVMR